MGSQKSWTQLSDFHFTSLDLLTWILLFGLESHDCLHPINEGHEGWRSLSHIRDCTMCETLRQALLHFTFTSHSHKNTVR